MGDVPARIAVTGASGFFGKHLVMHLAGLEQVESILAMDIREPVPDASGKVQVARAQADPRVEVRRRTTGC